MKHAEKNIYFRNVYVFIERVKNMTIIKENEMIKNNFYIYLQSITLK